MSASREKKDRQGEVAQGLTQKQLKEAKEAQAAKRKVVTYWVIGIVLALLVAALLVWDSGFFQKRATAAVVGGENLSAGEMQYYYGLARSSELSVQEQYAQLAAYGITYPAPENCVAYDFNSAQGDAQIYNTVTNQTYADLFRENGLNTARQIAALNAAAKADNYTLSAAGKTNLQDGVAGMKSQVKAGGWASFNAYLNRVYGKFVDEGVYKSCQEKAALASEYQAHHSDSLTYTTSQFAQYAEENPALLRSYDFQYCYIPGDPEVKTGDDGKTIEATDEEKEAATAAAKEKADAMAKGIKTAAGDKSEAFNSLVKDAVADDSTYADPTKNRQTNVLGADLTQNGTPPYFEWLSDTGRKAGDVTTISSGTGYYVVLFLGAQLDETPTADVRHILIRAQTPVDDPATEDVDESLNPPAQEELDRAKASAQAILDEFNALPTDKRTADAFGKLAGEKSEDSGSNTKGGLYPYVRPGEMVPEFDAWLFDSARQSGDTGLVSNVEAGSQYYGYHVMYYVGQNGPKWHELAQNALRGDDMTKWMESIQEPITAEWTSGGDIIGK